ncbi:unnamed protein product [Eruca vesicaria subsp. sativa]|uniref:Uncharacterized protein n=1 Tax=Eruca vesicaria subsp. sativa TaxID=29727 RepID=A0ABC8JM07_ERUVS|nr:unnamed protein product [Eruca vesicaria subsp. sativa]
MKTVTGRVSNAKPISLAKAATLLSGFVSSETQASQDVSAYLRRASAAFAELKSFHREIRSTNPKFELGGAKGTDDLVENANVTGDESVHGRKQDKKKKKKRVKENKEEDVVEEKVMVKLEDEQKNKERKKKKSKEEDVTDEKVNEKLEEEKKSKKKRKLLSKEI